MTHLILYLFKLFIVVSCLFFERASVSSRRQTIYTRNYPPLQHTYQSVSSLAYCVNKRVLKEMCHGDAKDNTDKQSNEFEMADFILERLRELLGCGKRAAGESEEDSVGNDSERQEPNKTPKISLSTIAFQSHQLRREVRKIQLRNPRLLRKNVRKGKNLRAKGRRRHLKLAASGIMALNGLNQESMFTRLDLLTSKVVRDDEREEIELLSLLRLLRMSHSEDTEEASSEAMMDDIVITSFITTASLTMTTACVDDTRSRTPGYQALDLFRHRASYRGLPQHLRGKQLQDQLRSAATVKNNPPAKRKASTSSKFKYYSFV